MFRRYCAIFLFAALVFATGTGVAYKAHGEGQSFVTTYPPETPSAFQFEDGQGKALNLDNFRGRYVLLNLWAASCVPCATEMPALNDLSKKLDSQAFAVIALAEDPDGIDAVRSFYKRHGIDSLPIYSDPSGRTPFILHVRGLPTTLLIDPRGFEIARLEGAAEWTQDGMVAYLKGLAKR